MLRSAELPDSPSSHLAVGAFLLQLMYNHPSIFWRGLRAVFLWCIQGCVNDTEHIGVLMYCGKLSGNHEIIIVS